MSFAEAKGSLYLSAGTSVYRRIDGPDPTWEQVYTDDTPYHWANAGVRGLTVVPCPKGSGESLVFANVHRMIRIDLEDDYAPTVELLLDEFLAKEWDRRVDTRDIIAAYSGLEPVEDPRSGEIVHVTGVMAKASGPHTFHDWYPGAGFLVRRPDASYRFSEVNGRWQPGDPLLVAARTLKASPFPEDGGKVYYLGGYDSNFIEAHDNAWIYRTTVEALLDTGR
jgi:hypothetical protein